MRSLGYQLTHCAKCRALVGGGSAMPVHAGLGRASPEIGYQLYRCAVCHARWSLGPRGWIAETA